MREILAIATISGALALAGCSSTHGPGDAAQSSTAATASAKPDITQLSLPIVAGRESFPDIPDPQWRAPFIDEYGFDGRITPMPEPRECLPLLRGVPHGKNSAARAILKSQGVPRREYNVEITLPSGSPPNWNALLDKCGTITRRDAHYTMQRIANDQIPSWAVAIRVQNGDTPCVAIIGNYRGVVITALAAQQPNLTAEDATAATKLFTDQVAKLEAA